MTKNYEVFVKDPRTAQLPNNGVASVSEVATDEQIRTLRFELDTFVCEGEYARGLDRILRSYLANLDKPEQPAVWVSGFTGSGKSHLVKMLRFLWPDFTFPGDQVTARGLAHLPDEVNDLLRELSTQGKRTGGLHAVSGSLRGSGVESVRLALLSIVFRSAGLPEEYPLGRFVMRLKSRGHLDVVKSAVEAAGEDFAQELRHLYVSPVIAKAILDADPEFAASPKDVLSLIKTQFPSVKDVSNTEMVQAIKDAIGQGHAMPCTLIVLDEVQQYIGEDSSLSDMVREVTEACSKGLGSRLLFVATGQSALTGTPQLQKLRDRFRITIDLSDTDVDTVIRQVVLQKKPDKTKAIAEALAKYSGEISRHLVDTKIGPRTEDDEFMEADYPLLPVRRRFWENALRAVDRPGTAGQLRTQLRIVLEALHALAEKPLGTVIPADFLYDQLSTDLVQTGVLLREIEALIKEQRDGSPEGLLRSRLLALIYLIGQLPRDPGVDIGVRANPETLADLLVEDLQAGSSQLRQSIPDLLKDLLESGHVMEVENEYKIQTQESRAWDSDYRQRLARIQNDNQRMAMERADLLREKTGELLKQLRILHGASRVPRRIELFFNADLPQVTGQTIPVWIRDEWAVSLKSIQDDARQTGTDSPVIHVFLPRRSAESLNKALAGKLAAKETLDSKGVPSTDPGKEARQSIESRKLTAEQNVAMAVDDVFHGARVFTGGGNEVTGSSLKDMVEDAARTALARMFPNFGLADDARWEQVVKRARRGDVNALEALDYKGEPHKHSVCAEILKSVGTWKAGREIRREFTSAPYGWSQDAVDGALLVLLVAGQIRARYKDAPQELNDLDQTRIGVAEFRSETRVLTAAERIRLRKLFHSVGIPCKPNEEIAAVAPFFQEMNRRAAEAGGEPPLPERPGTAHIKEAEGLSGNEQLAKICELADRLEKEASDWQRAAELTAKRRPRWETLERLLRHATGMPEAAEVGPQVEAIRANRSLLADPDPVPPLCDKLTNALRNALGAAHQAFAKLREKHLADLETDQSWKKVAPEKCQELLEREQLAQVPDIKVGTEAELIRELERAGIENWRERADALPTRFRNVQLRAAKLFEPKAVQARIPKATLHNEKEVDRWLADTKKEIMEQLDDPDVGAVII